MALPVGSREWLRIYKGFVLLLVCVCVFFFFFFGGGFRGLGFRIQVFFFGWGLRFRGLGDWGFRGLGVSGLGV